MTSDDELRTTFRWVLDHDPQCPLTDDARRNGSDDPGAAWLMTGFLVATVHNACGEFVATARAHRAVVDEFAARRAAAKRRPPADPSS